MSGKFLSSLLVVVVCGQQAAAQPALPPAYGTPFPVNYVRVWEATAPETDAGALINRPLKDVKQNTKYIDGLGRTIQTVAKQASLTSSGIAKDVVAPFVYDEMGREKLKYLPFAASTPDGLFKTDPFPQQVSFYNTLYAGQMGETNIGVNDLNWAFKENWFEAAQSARPLESFQPGVNWAGTAGQANAADRHSLKLNYYNNTAADSVRIWQVSNGALGSFGSYSSPGFYQAGQLFKVITINENGRQSIEYRDRDGLTILKKVQLWNVPATGHSGWLCTYSIYDNENNLRCVIQPEGVKRISPAWSIDATTLSELCFRFEYDVKNRMILKKMPGADVVYQVFDARDRVVLTQDGNMRSGSPQKWLYTLYDDFNRPIENGLWTNNQAWSFHTGEAQASSAYPDLGGQTIEPLSRLYYDTYTWAGSTYFSAKDNSFDPLFISTANVWPYAQPLTQSLQTRGLVTGSWDGKNNLTTANFYDDKGRLIQTKADNISGGYTVLTTQYNYAGQTLMAVSWVQKAGVNAKNFMTGTKNHYDDLGRVIRVEKSISQTSSTFDNWNTIATNEFDALGRLVKKTLAPDYNEGDGLDSLSFDYNIRNWALGMNRRYARDEHEDNYFGYDLGYDKVQNNLIGNQNYAAVQYSGNVAGTVWKSKGDGEKRKYDYTYDAADRISGADFNQYNGSGFDKSANVDYSVSNLTFDANGNLLSMKQNGLKLGGSSAIDQLRYTYATGSNRLEQVWDTANDNTSKLRDFRYDAATKTSTDYTYDSNGNILTDNNKKISSITYNNMNLPEIIRIMGKGKIEFFYDPKGNKLKKVTTDSTGSTVKVKTVLYLGQAVFENDTLQFIGMEEGRIRYKARENSFAYDYMVKDHLGNVRLVLTEERDTTFYDPATMETANAGYEEAVYGNINNTRTSKPGTYPADDYTDPNPNTTAAKVRGDGNKIGPSKILKVMAGDKINIHVSSWWEGSTPSGTASPLTDVVAALISSAPGVSSGKVGSGQLTTGLLNPQVTDFLNDQPYNDDLPKAYLNWILLDEQFKYVAGSSSAEQVGGSGDLTRHTPNGLTMAKNGYLYVYVSNESPVDVYFDNLQVTHIRGPILEETHYYPYGLTMAGISSKALVFGDPENTKFKFQNQEINEDLDLDLYEFKYRNHDPQIGRFIQLDPLSEKYVYNSPYAFSENKVTNGIELEGLEVVTLSGTADYMAFVFGGEYNVGFAYDGKNVAFYVSAGMRFGVGLSAGAGASLGYFPTMKSVQELDGQGWGASISGGLLAKWGVGIAYSSGHLGLAVNVEAGAGFQISVADTRTAIQNIWTVDQVAQFFGLKDAKSLITMIKNEALAALDKNIAEKNKEMTNVANEMAERGETIKKIGAQEKVDKSDLKKIEKETNKINKLGKKLDKLQTEVQQVEDAKKDIQNLGN